MLGEYLKECRIEAGLTQGQLAKLLGYTCSQYVSNVERGISEIPKPTAKKWCLLIDADRDFVLEEVVGKVGGQWIEALGFND